MPPQRTPLRLINRNTPRKGHLTEFERGRIIGIHNNSAKKAVIQRFYSHLYSTIRDTIEKEALRHNGYSLPYISRLKSYSPAEEQLVLRYIRKFPKDIYKEVIKAYAVIFKKDTVKKILKEYRIKN